jgi:DNA-binding LacI/PurR family transcriptional regulator
VIWLDNDLHAANGCLRRDEYRAGAEAAKLLLARGRTRIVWLQRPEYLRNHFSLRDREAGARAVCAASGVPFVEHHQEPGVAPVDGARLQAELAIPGTGLLLATPAQVRWAAVFLPALGLRPGTDLGLAACDSDGQIDISWPALSRVRHDRYGLGRKAAEMLLTLLTCGTAPASTVVDGELHPGTTA